MRPRQSHLRNAMKGIFDSVMIVPEPFAVAYGLEELLHTMVIDIGAGTTDFCLLNGRYPSENERRTLMEAGDAVDRELAKLVRDRYSEVQFSIHMIREWKEKWGFVGEPEESADAVHHGVDRGDPQPALTEVADVELDVRAGFPPAGPGRWSRTR